MAIETEIKIQVETHKPIINRLKSLKAEFKGSFYQKDVYFDNSSGAITAADSCLRLRTETDGQANTLKSVLCFKGHKLGGFVKAREELETSVTDPGAATKILQALGYIASLSFNKKRTVWVFNNCEVCLDEVALIGCFVEIEGAAEEVVVETAKQLSLPIDRQTLDSYAHLVNQRLKQDGADVKEAYLEEPKIANEAPDTAKKGFAVIIINPASGSGFAASITENLKECLENRGISVKVEIIKEFDDLPRYCKEATDSPDCKLIAVCGGDGTIREAVKHILGSEIPLMVLPGGTGNLLAHELGCGKELDIYEQMLEDQSICSLDIAMVNNSCFTSVLGIGLDAEIVELLTKSRNGNITQADYIWPIWRGFWAHELPEFEVEADGEQLFKGSGMLFVGNISRYGPGLRILKDANFTDGLLDLCIYPCKSKTEILKYLTMTMLQIHTNASEVIYKKCRSLRIAPLNEQILTQIDGDPGPSMPLNIEIIPAAVKVYSNVKKDYDGKA